MKMITRLISVVLWGALLYGGLKPLPAVAASPSATLYLAPATRQVTPSQIFSIELRVNIVDSNANAVDAKLTYPTDKIEVTGITSSAAFPGQFGDSYGSGSISITHFTYSSVSGDQLVATIDLKSKNVLGQAEINIDKSSSTVTADDGKGTNILSAVNGAVYTISSNSGGSTSSGNQSSTAPSVQPSQPIGQPTQLNSQSKPQTSSTNSDNLQPAAPGTSVTSTLSGNVSQQAPQATSPVIPTSQYSWVVNVLKIVGSFGLAFAALELRNINRRRRKTVKKRTKAHETVADIAKRINSKDRANETVAELAARLRRQSKADETVAELAARMRRKKAKKSAKRRPKKKRKS